MTHPALPRPPQNVSQALDAGGLPEGFTRDQLQWLAARHVDLATRRGNQMSSRDYWRLRWAYTCADILRTINDPRTYARLPP